MIVNFENIGFIHILLAAVCALFVVILCTEVIDITKYFRSNNQPVCQYSYSPLGGPTTWREKFPECLGARQSPINLPCNSVIVVCSETMAPLTFSCEYNVQPQTMRAYNDGHTVTLYACWPDHVGPKISGGPLPCEYKFFNIRIRWGPNNEEGSEHTINCQRYAMEMQASYIKTDKTYFNLMEVLENNALLIVSYLFQITRSDNPYIKPLTCALQDISTPYRFVDINPIPLACIMPTFCSKYYTYCGSLTFPPCTEGVMWMVQSEPLGISTKQVNKFRKLCSFEGPMDINTRPVQDLHNREVYFYD